MVLPVSAASDILVAKSSFATNRWSNESFYRRCGKDKKILAR